MLRSGKARKNDPPIPKDFAPISSKPRKVQPKQDEFEPLPEVIYPDQVSEFDQQLRGQGMDLDTYFQYVGKTAEDFRKEVKEDAYKRVKTRMLISKIAEQENFEVSNDEINTELENMAKQYGLEADKLREMIGAENVGMIAGDIKIRKAVEFIYDNAAKK